MQICICLSDMEHVREWEGIGVYKGGFVEADGQKVAQGAGCFEYANGDHYDGEWHAGCKHGAGKGTRVSVWRMSEKGVY